MRERTKHQAKRFLTGLGVLLGVWAWYWLIVGGPWGKGPTYIPPVGTWNWSYVPWYVGWAFLGGTIVGILTMALAIWPEKYESRYCNNCLTETHQFLSKTNYKKDYKVKLGKTAENKANTESQEYTCEKCGKKNIVKVSGQSPLERRLQMKFCRKCGGKILSESEFCENCGARLI